jgi:hypothetical protein
VSAGFSNVRVANCQTKSLFLPRGPYWLHNYVTESCIISADPILNAVPGSSSGSPSYVSQHLIAVLVQSLHELFGLTRSGSVSSLFLLDPFSYDKYLHVSGSFSLQTKH